MERSNRNELSLGVIIDTTLLLIGCSTEVAEVHFRCGGRGGGGDLCEIFSAL
jgi:hypothetical protein